jgi:hypothetical protein
MSDRQLRSDLIRLAAANPAVRAAVLPLLTKKTAAGAKTAAKVDLGRGLDILNSSLPRAARISPKDPIAKKIEALLDKGADPKAIADAIDEGEIPTFTGATKQLQVLLDKYMD